MKDFSQLLEQKQQKVQRIHSLPIKDVQIKERTLWDDAKDKVIKLSGPILTIFTGPFTTASILLQVSQKPASQSFARKMEIYGKENKLVRTGIYGDNKIYKPFEFKGYHDALSQLGKQGIRGLYKGNLSGIILGLANAKLRTYLYQQSNKLYNFSQQWKSNLLTILTCSIADLITLPLLFSQTRLVYQNSLSNFRTYSGIFDTLKSSSPKKWMSGASVIILKNILFSYSWISFFKNNPVQSFVFSTILSHIVTYPFMTVIRQLQSNQSGTPMMNQRSQNVRQCVKRIWNTMGIRGYYRGFFGYSIVHTFLNFIMIDANIRTGYFKMMSGN